MRNNLNLSVPDLAYGDCIPQVSNTIIHLDLIMQELLERRDIEDFVGSGLGGVDDELVGGKKLALENHCSDREKLHGISGLEKNQSHFLRDLAGLLASTASTLSQSARALGFLRRKKKF